MGDGRRFLNDPLEAKYADVVLTGALEPLLEGGSKQVQAFFRTALGNLTKLPEHRQIFLTSLSEDDDSLSQWIAYADNARGFAVGIAGRYLSDHQMFFLRRVLYDSEAQKKLATRILEIYVSCLGNALDSGDYELAEVYGEIFTIAIHLLTLCFKDLAFKHEREWRLIDISIPGFRHQPVQVRPHAAGVVPYVEFPISSGTDLQIREIVIGPALDYTQNEAGLMLLKESAAIGFQIRGSSIKFRSGK